MPQVTIYLDRETERLLRREIKAARMSASRFVARLIQDEAASRLSPELLAALGTWKEGDFPGVSALRSRLGRDVRREKL